MKKTLIALAILGLVADAQALDIKEVKIGADGSRTETTYTVSDAFAAQIVRFNTAPVLSVSAGDPTVLSRPIPSFTDRAGNQFTLGPAGQVYRNGVRLSSLSSTGTEQKMLAQRIVSFGNEIYALGMTDQRWWKWDGSVAVNKWTAVPTDFDTSVLQ